MKIKLSLSTKINGGKSELLSRIVIGRGKDYRVKLHLFIEPTRFKDGKIIIPRINSPEQKELQKIKSKLDNLIQFLTDKLLDPKTTYHSSADIQRIVDDYFNPENKSSFFYVWDRWVSQCKVSELRLKKYKVLHDDLIRYEQHYCKTLTLGLTSEDIASIEVFLRKEHTWDKTKKKRSDTTIRSLLNVLSAFYTWMIREGYVTISPFIHYTKPKEIFGTPYFLTIEERNRIADFPFDAPHLIAQRDIFIFQCLIGCRVGDLLRLTDKNIVDGFIEYTPSKTITETTKFVRVPINDKARAIIDKYSGCNTKLLPFISAQKYNDAIKNICRIAGIDRLITVINPITHQEERKPIYEVASSHMARRTFIGNLYNQVQDPNIIGSMSGHAEGSKAFSRYRTIGDDVKKKVIELIR